MKRTCGAPDCARPVVARGLCSMHYQRAWKAGSLLPPVIRCADCGVEILDSNGGRKRCEPCGDEHQKRRQRDWHKANPRPRKPLVVGECVLCGDPTPPSARRRTKCERCAQESASQRCTEDGCDRPARARRLCSMHYKRQARAEGRIIDDLAWTPRRQANYERRRAMKAGATVGEPFTNGEIFERDRWVCRLCHRSVDSELAWPHPMSASLDHLVPLSEGGAHSKENTALAHLRCNVRKGNRAVGEQLALIG